MRIQLVSMPWQALNLPSLPVGLLHSVVRRARPGDVVGEYHGSIRWAEYLLRASGGELSPRDYWTVADEGIFHGLGEWVFAAALTGDPHWQLEEYGRYAAGCGLDLTTPRRMRDLAEGFVDLAVTEVLASEPDLVGLTTTFMQNVPSLALARRIKQRSPGTTVVLGGGNCDGVMGAALHRNHRFVDYVVRGEGEQSFPALLDRIDAGEPVADLPGVCWWDGDRSVDNTPSTQPVAPACIPVPDFDAWFAAIGSSPVRAYQSALFLVVEGARGCWWGEKHHCTFCGLNGSMMAFRSKSPEQFWVELDHLVRRHQVLDIVTVDNILSMEYLRTLLPRLATTGWDLRIYYEIKSNLRSEQVAALAEAGVVLVQPGIESLSGRVLDLMDKGVDGTANVRLLRDCETNHITVQWNYLYGFPGEVPDDYAAVSGQIPALVHLQPPTIVTRVVLERFSPYHERPELGFRRRAPLPFYRHVYRVPAAELDDLAYFFESDSAGISGEPVRDLVQSCATWSAGYPRSSLLAVDGSDGALVLWDRRHGWPARDHYLEGWQAHAYRGLSRGRSPGSLRQHLDRQGCPVEPDRVALWLADMRSRGLVFVDGERWVALATGDVTLPVASPRAEGMA